ncbi:MAG: hypothetical protein ACOCVX_05375 [Bacteroidales bacterium]
MTTKKILVLQFTLKVDPDKITDKAIEDAARKFNDCLHVRKSNSYETEEIKIKMIDAHAETV